MSSVPASITSSMRPLARVIGLVLIVAAPVLGWTVWHATAESIAEFERAAARRTLGDSAAYASAAYHASHAAVIRAERWHLTGFATLSVLGCTLGAIALASGSWRRTS